MKRFGKAAIALTAGTLLATSPVFAQKDAQQGQGRAIVTVLPSAKNGNAGQISAQNLKVKVNGKDSTVTSFNQLQESSSPVELVLMLDSGARANLGTQFNEIQAFVKEMPPNTRMAIAYMQQGRAVFSSQLSSNAADVLKGLHLSSGIPGENASPYFCLSDLAKNWPSHDRTARREVVMVTDGVDNYERRFDPDDPYVQTAIKDSVRAGLVVYSIYWQNTGRLNSTGYETNAGQNLLLLVTQATGGNSYWEGLGNPVSLQPFFQDLRRRLNNQYEVSFTAPSNGKPQVETLKVDLHVPSAKVAAPQQVLVTGPVSARGE
ncbi:hypothetical protein [Occallatibacter savannae]|uniref:hypothetical protein n=1 Tax=Occallatibacter savannae TaxID=1002691 RepID=UPI000D6860FE|nr:hypothetical protein [Occallatibacter savannae]